MTEKPGVYSIEQLSTGRVYIGSTINLSRRLSRHRRDLIKGEHFCEEMQKQFQLKGIADFNFEVVEITEDFKKLEQLLLDMHTGPLFNKNPSAYSSEGRKASEAECKMRKAILLKAQKLITPAVLKRRGRSYSSNPLNHKLTLEQELKLLSEYAPVKIEGYRKVRGKVSMEFLSKKYSVSIERVWSIIHGMKGRKCLP